MTKSFEWCSVENCLSSREKAYVGENASNGSNNGSINFTCPGYPLCVQVLTKTIDNTHVRIYDLLLVFGNAVFLVVLFAHMVPTVKKLVHSFLLFKILYSMVFVIPAMSLIHGIINMCVGYQKPSAKLTQVLVRGSILMTEICVVIFGLFFRSYADQMMKLCFTVFAIVVLTAMFTVAEGVSEFLRLDKHLACHQLDLFTHGGMVFLFTTSVIFATVYFLIYLMYLLGLSKRWDFPSKKSFYRYAMVLSVINVVQAVGSMLWYTGKERRASGSAGICITSFTTFVYLTTFAPVVYWIFLKNYFRMNKPPRVSQSEAAAINTSEDPHSPRSVTKTSVTSGVRFSKPYLIGRRSTYFEEQTMLEGDLDSSVSSYGSFRDEEIFSRLEK